MAGKPGMHKERMSYRFGEEYQAKLRAKIKIGMILEALTSHIVGEREMTASQVTACLGLLRKAMPDLASTEIKAEVTNYRDTLSRIAESMGWATAAAQVAKEEGDTSNAAPHTEEDTSGAMSDDVQVAD